MIWKDVATDPPPRRQAVLVLRRSYGVGLAYEVDHWAGTFDGWASGSREADVLWWTELPAIPPELRAELARRNESGVTA